MKTMQEADYLSPLYLYMVDDAMILYDADGFFRKILDRLSAGLKRLGSRKISIGRKWYWDLKPDIKHGEVVVIE